MLHINRFLLLKTFIIILLSGICSKGLSQIPQWAINYPQIFTGSSSIDLKIQVNNPGKLIYVVYKTDPLNTSNLLIHAQNPSAYSTVAKGGSVSINSADINKELFVSVNGLTSGNTYYIYLALTNQTNSIIEESIKKYTKEFPLPQTGQNDYIVPGYITGYLAYLPDEYQKYSNKAPLLIFFHGTGEKGGWDTPNFNVLSKTALPAYLNNNQVPLIVVSPQCPVSWGYKVGSDPAGFDKFVEFIKQKYNIDEKRIYLTGISDGGGGLYEYSVAYPSKIAAMLPISTYPGNRTSSYDIFSQIPMWSFMGSDDGYAGSLTLMKESVARGGIGKFTLYNGVGHNAWDRTYNLSGMNSSTDPIHDPFDENIYDWLLKFTNVRSTPNQSPKANAGSDKTIILPTNSVQLTGSGTDTDGTITGYQWTQVSGPGTSTMSGQTTTTLTASGLVAGEYVFRLTVTDNSGAKGSDDVKVTVNAAANKAPASSAGSDKTITLPTNSVQLTGSGTDTDGTITGYQWTQVSGPNTSTFSNPTTATATASGLVAGDYVFRLTVTDNDGANGSDEVKVTVLPIPNNTTVEVDSEMHVYTFDPLVISANVSNQALGQYIIWKKISGTNSITYSYDDENLYLSQFFDGLHTFVVYVLYQDDIISTDTINIYIHPSKPVLPVNEYKLCEGESLPLDAPAGYSYKLKIGTNEIMEVVISGKYNLYMVNDLGLESQPIEISVSILNLPEQPIVIDDEGILTIKNIDLINTYHWMTGNENVYVKNAEEFIPAINGNYYVRVTNSDGCSVESDTIQYKLEDYFIVNVYPNPSNGSFYVRTKFFPFETMDISIKNMSDKLYYLDSIRDPNKTEQIAITLGNAPNGVYIMNLNNQYFKKIIITNR